VIEEIFHVDRQTDTTKLSVFFAILRTSLETLKIRNWITLNQNILTNKKLNLIPEHFSKTGSRPLHGPRCCTSWEARKGIIALALEILCYVRSAIQQSRIARY